jgi:thymidylate synthase ThyX
MYTKTIVTSTEWENFFQLRCHKDAQPEIKVLADLMLEIYLRNIPDKLKYGEWHLPYVTDIEFIDYPLDDCIKMSSSRCARVSYLTHDGKVPSKEKDFKLYEDLVGSIPIHASPTEHQATPTKDTKFNKNFRGWKQHRADIEHKFNK